MPKRLKPATKAQVFIIESLDVEDEEHRKEGEILSRTLRLAGKDPIYRYVRTKPELEHFIAEFQKSAYRYLHVSVHGNFDLIALTLDNLTGEDFAAVVGPALGGGRRLFLSTCRAATVRLAQSVFCHGGCRSVVGPKKKIDFDDSAIFWSSFYHLMFKRERGRMLDSDLEEVVDLMGKAIGHQFRLLTPSDDGPASEKLLPMKLAKMKRRNTGQ